MKKVCIIIAIFLLCMLCSCAADGIMEHDGTELAGDELESMYQSQQEADPDPQVQGNGRVYWTASGKKYHRDPECTYLSRAKQIYSGSMAEAADHGADSPCSGCGGE